MAVEQERPTQIVVLNELSFIKTMMFKERFAGVEGESHADTRGKSVPGPGNHVFRHIELGVCLDVQGTAKKPVWLVQTE